MEETVGTYGSHSWAVPQDDSKGKGRDTVDWSWVLTEAWVRVFRTVLANLFQEWMCWGCKPIIFHLVCSLVSQKKRSAYFMHIK